jgi:hypothetical protein
MFVWSHFLSFIS